MNNPDIEENTTKKNNEIISNIGIILNLLVLIIFSLYTKLCFTWSGNNFGKDEITLLVINLILLILLIAQILIKNPSKKLNLIDQQQKNDPDTKLNLRQWIIFIIIGGLVLWGFVLNIIRSF